MYAIYIRLSFSKSREKRGRCVQRRPFSGPMVANRRACCRRRSRVGRMPRRGVRRPGTGPEQLARRLDGRGGPGRGERGSEFCPRARRERPWRLSEGVKLLQECICIPFRAGPDPRLVDAYHRQRETFERAVVARPGWGERIAIPFEGKSLHGYFFAAAGSGRPAPTLLMTGGYDSTAEEAYFYSGPAALARAYNFVCST